MNKLNVILYSSLLLVALSTISTSFAETVIIVHPSNNVASNPSIIKQIFLGKAKEFDGGGEAIPVEMPEGNAARSTFNSDFLGKSDAQMKSYWGRLIFTGKASAPEKASSDDDMIKKVANDPKLIGYIDYSKVTDAVKVVHTF